MNSRFRIEVVHEKNDLHGMVEIISTDGKSAREMALRVFFRGGGWKVTEVLREIKK